MSLETELIVHQSTVEALDASTSPGIVCGGMDTEWLTGIWTLNDWVVELRMMLGITQGLIIHVLDDQDRLPYYWGWSPRTGYVEAVHALPPDLPEPIQTYPLLVQGQWAGMLLLWEDTPPLTQELPLLALSVQLTRLMVQQQRMRLERMLLLSSLSESPDSAQALMQSVIALLNTHLPLKGCFGILLDWQDGNNPACYLGDLHREAAVIWHPLTLQGRILGYLGAQSENWTEDVMEALGMLCQILSHRLAERLAHDAATAQSKALQVTLDQLQTAQLQLIQSEKLAVVGQFVAGIAHEVNTPLAAVTSNNQLIQQLTAHCTDLEDIQPLLELSANACERMRQTVKNLKAFARLDHTEEKTRVDVWQSLLDTLAILKGSIPPNVRVELKTPEELPIWANGYAGLLNIVWMNLLVNALHAVERKPDGLLILRCWQDAEHVTWVQVQDNGCGIPAEIRHRIFDPGFTTKGPGVGTGLGLSLCLQMVQKHNGELLVQSSPNKGTCMTVRLPMA
jgi:signal transduction histidine kinase